MWERNNCGFIETQTVKQDVKFCLSSILIYNRTDILLWQRSRHLCYLMQSADVRRGVCGSGDEDLWPYGADPDPTVGLPILGSLAAEPPNSIIRCPHGAETVFTGVFNECSSDNQFHKERQMHSEPFMEAPTGVLFCVHYTDDTFCSLMF